MGIAKSNPEKTAADLGTNGEENPTSESTSTETRPPLRPELRQAIEESWKKHESAYRYLGR